MASDHEQCAACGFDGSSFADADLLAAFRSLGAHWRELLAGAGAELRVRPQPGTWSALEYAVHSRDVTALHAFGVEQALTRDEPRFPPFDEDRSETAVAASADADPVAVVDALELAARQLVRLTETAGAGAWDRGLTVGDQRSDVRRLLEHALHDSRHHLDDVERGLVSLRSDPC